MMVVGNRDRHVGVWRAGWPGSGGVLGLAPVVQA